MSGNIYFQTNGITIDGFRDCEKLVEMATRRNMMDCDC